jgi:DNA-directed RNA polymerase subunit E'
VRARIVTKSIDERNPRDSKIGLTAKQVGLGRLSWLREDREESETPSATGD